MNLISKKLVKNIKKLIINKDFKYESKELILPIKYFNNQLKLHSILLPDRSLNSKLGSEFDNCSKFVYDCESLNFLPKGHRSVLAKVQLPNKISHSSNPRETKWLVLDKIGDPKNMGTLIHTAALMEWDHVFVIKGSCDPLSIKTIESSVGSVLKFNWSWIGYDELMEKVKENGFDLIVSENPPFTKSPLPVLFNRQNFESINSHNLSKFALVLGSEHHGVSRNIQSNLGLGIPIDPRLESLNVSSAAAILMYYLSQNSQNKI